MSDTDPLLDPVFDRGMTAHANGLPRTANPHGAGTLERAVWDSGWLTGRARSEQAEADEALL